MQMAKEASLVPFDQRSDAQRWAVQEATRDGVTDRFRLGWNQYRDHPELTPRTPRLGIGYVSDRVAHM